MSLLTLAISIGLAVSVLFSEAFGIAAGGMVVPGYLALNMDRPLNVALTFATGLATYAVVQALSTVMVVYGRRRTVLMILVGYVLGVLVRWAVTGADAPLFDGVEVIGYIIPGLIAIWFARQGVVETTASAVSAAVVVRLILLIVVGEEIGPS